MKYIKKFNESLETFTKENIREICEERLAELYDDGFKVLLSVLNGGKTIMINLIKNGEEFEWNDIKDIYIAFISFLDEKFKIKLFRENVGPFYKYLGTENDYIVGGRINNEVLVSLKVFIEEK